MTNWQKILYALLAVAVVTAGAWGVPKLLQRLHACADGVEQTGGECVGVNGGGYDFGSRRIGAVARAIAAENREVVKRRKSEPYVTVAMMLPLQSGNPALQRQMRSDLQGAYLGQRQVNAGEGELPKIRLVLANPGRDYAHQEQVVDALVDMARSPEDRLRAVTGFNLSLDHTKAAVRELTKHRVPVLASRISGDDIANLEGDSPRFPGLARILPTNHDAAQALANFNRAKGRKDEKTVLVSDSREDGYNRTLRKAFGDIGEEGPPGPEEKTFTSPGIDEPGSSGNAFTQIANNICGSKADTVYFAGRALHLRIFALKLARDSCKNRHYTIISGSDAASLREDMDAADWAQLRGKDGRPKVTVQYAAPAHPQAWSRELAAQGGKRPQYLTEPAAALRTLRNRIQTTREEGVQLGAGPDLEDSRTMLVYDGLLTIGDALHNAQGNSRKVPAPATVGDQWRHLETFQRVSGTSGWICLTNQGNPYDKPVSVVELDPGRSGRGKLEFKGLGWPLGRPQPDKCSIPSGS